VFFVAQNSKKFQKGLNLPALLKGFHAGYKSVVPSIKMGGKADII